MPGTRRSPLLVPLGIALVAHAAALYWVRWDRSPATVRDSSLRISLRRPAPAEQDTLKPVALPEPERVRDEPTEPPASSSRPPPPTPNDDHEEARRTPFSAAIIESARRGVREAERDAVEAPRYRSFSVGDFPRTEGDGETDPWRRPSGLRQFVRAPEVVEYTDVRGELVIRRVDGFGNITCSKRIHIPGEGNGPLWYRLPAGTVC